MESAVYFAVAEALTNSAKHAAAQHAWVWIRHDGGTLTVMVGDDGVGGAQLTAEGGLAGIEAAAGRLRRHPVDGQPARVVRPIVTIKVPCVLRACHRLTSAA